MTGDRHAIGHRGVRVSPLGFGGAPIGNLYAPVTEADAQAALEEALERGIRYFDTAPFYGHGLSETRMGRALAGRPRDSFVVSTKVGRRIARDGSVSQAVNDGFAVAWQRHGFSVRSFSPDLHLAFRDVD